MTNPSNPLPVALPELMPCPFCGAGELHISESTHWTGMQSVVLSVTVTHWCERNGTQPQSVLQVKGRTREDAIAAWNRRPLAAEALRGREGLYTPRYFVDGPEGHFGCDDLELAERLLRAIADDPDEWTATDTHDPAVAEEIDTARNRAALDAAMGEGK